MEQQIRELIADQLLNPSGREQLGALSDSACLLEAGLLTSLDVVQLVALLEARFGVIFDALDIDLEHLGSVAGIARMIARKQADG